MNARLLAKGAALIGVVLGVSLLMLAFGAWTLSAQVPIFETVYATDFQPESETDQPVLTHQGWLTFTLVPANGLDPNELDLGILHVEVANGSQSSESLVWAQDGDTPAWYAPYYVVLDVQEMWFESTVVDEITWVTLYETTGNPWRTGHHVDSSSGAVEPSIIRDADQTLVQLFDFGEYEPVTQMYSATVTSIAPTFAYLTYASWDSVEWELPSTCHKDGAYFLYTQSVNQDILRVIGPISSTVPVTLTVRGPEGDILFEQEVLGPYCEEWIDEEDATSVVFLPMVARTGLEQLFYNIWSGTQTAFGFLRPGR